MKHPFIKRLAVDLPFIEANHLSYMLTSQGDPVKMGELESFQRIRASLAPKVERAGAIAICPIQGTLAYGPDLFEMIWDGVEDSRAVTRMLNDVADDDDIEGCLLRMDTPGGMLLGGPEMADAVTRMKMKKPVICHVGGMGASLGYMIASQSTKIIANRSAIVGSIGVIASIADYTGMLEQMGIKFEYFTNKEAKFKGAGAIGTQLTDDQRAQLQSSIDDAFKLFKGMVLSTRPGVPDSAMQGQTFRGSDALKQGLVDATGDESYAISVLKSFIKK